MSDLNSKKILAVIPARGGSQSVPNKNIRLLCGRPLIDYTIEAALESKCITKIVVSSDSDEILKVAGKFPVDLIKRPPHLATDEAPTLPVVLHALEEAEKTTGSQYDVIVVLQATTPLRSGKDIDCTLEVLFKTGFDSAASVAEIHFGHPLKVKKIVDGMLVNYFGDEIEGKRRQDLEKVFARNGGVYAATRTTVCEKNSLFGNHCAAYVMPAERSWDINSEFDLRLVEAWLTVSVEKYEGSPSV